MDFHRMLSTMTCGGGTWSYLATNWILLGATTGRGKDDQTHQPNRSLKQVLGYPLTTHFRKLLQET